MGYKRYLTSMVLKLKNLFNKGSKESVGSCSGQKLDPLANSAHEVQEPKRTRLKKWLICFASAIALSTSNPSLKKTSLGFQFEGNQQVLALDEDLQKDGDISEGNLSDLDSSSCAPNSNETSDKITTTPVPSTNKKLSPKMADFFARFAETGIRNNFNTTTKELERLRDQIRQTQIKRDQQDVESNSVQQTLSGIELTNKGLKGRLKTWPQRNRLKTELKAIEKTSEYLDKSLDTLKDKEAELVSRRNFWKERNDSLEKREEKEKELWQRFWEKLEAF